MQPYRSLYTTSLASCKSQPLSCSLFHIGGRAPPATLKPATIFVFPVTSSAEGFGAFHLFKLERQARPFPPSTPSARHETAAAPELPNFPLRPLPARHPSTASPDQAASELRHQRMFRPRAVLPTAHTDSAQWAECGLLRRVDPKWQ